VIFVGTCAITSERKKERKKERKRHRLIAVASTATTQLNKVEPKAYKEGIHPGGRQSETAVERTVDAAVEDPECPEE